MQQAASVTPLFHKQELICFSIIFSEHYLSSTKWTSHYIPKAPNPRIVWYIPEPEQLLCTSSTSVSDNIHATLVSLSVVQLR